MLKNEAKIRKLLGSDYHLHEEIKENGAISWVLFKKYNDAQVYFSKDNAPIMSSEDSTEEDLLEFAKTHKKVDVYMVVSKTCFIISWLLFMICIANIFIKSSALTLIIYVAIIINLLYDFIVFRVYDKNFTVDMLELNDSLNKSKKRAKELEEEAKKLNIEFKDIEEDSKKIM